MGLWYRITAYEYLISARASRLLTLPRTPTTCIRPAANCENIIEYTNPRTEPTARGMSQCVCVTRLTCGRCRVSAIVPHCPQRRRAGRRT
eukprot:2953934-Prymnesium_polylepis.1